MSRHTGVAVVLACLSGCATVDGAASVQDVCAAPDVIDTVASQLRQHGVSGAIDARAPAQVTTPDSSVTTCTVWLTQPDFDTNYPPGQRFRFRVATQSFELRRLPHSYVVALSGPPVPLAGQDDRYRGIDTHP